jgi:hypothetical protein
VQAELREHVDYLTLTVLYQRSAHTPQGITTVGLGILA